MSVTDLHVNFLILKLKCILYMFLKYDEEPTDPQKICLKLLLFTIIFHHISLVVIFTR